METKMYQEKAVGDLIVKQDLQNSFLCLTEAIDQIKEIRPSSLSEEFGVDYILARQETLDMIQSFREDGRITCDDTISEAGHITLENLEYHRLAYKITGHEDKILWFTHATIFTIILIELDAHTRLYFMKKFYERKGIPPMS